MTTEGLDSGLASGHIGGLRTHWVNRGRPTLTAALMFRTGQMDEPLAIRGATHLVEHLAHGRLSAPGPLSTNASVDATTTGFHFHGPGADVWEALRRTLTFLAEPDLTRVAEEARILRAEDDFRAGFGDVNRAMVWRYGLRGPGVLHLPEPFLQRLDLDELNFLIHSRFTAGNAVLILDGEPPADLAKVLPAGDRLRLPSVSTCSNRFPASHRDPALLISGVVPRSPESTALPNILEWSLIQRVREQEGISYAPWSHYQVVDEYSAVVLAGADMPAKLPPSLLGHLSRDLDRLCEIGPEAESLENLVKARRQHYEDPDHRFGVAFAVARYWLDRGEELTADQIAGEWDGLTPGSIAKALRRWRETLIVGHPESQSSRDLLPIHPPSIRPEGGRQYACRYQGDDAVVTMNNTSVCIETGGAVTTSLRFEDLAMVHQFSDGGLTMADWDSWTLQLDPAEWYDGERLRAELLLRIPPTAVRLQRDQAMNPNRPADLDQPATKPRPNYWEIAGKAAVIVIAVVAVRLAGELWGGSGVLITMVPCLALVLWMVRQSHTRR